MHLIVDKKKKNSQYFALLKMTRDSNAFYGINLECFTSINLQKKKKKTVSLSTIIN